MRRPAAMMTNSDDDELDLFSAVVELPAAERGRYLDIACRDNSDLRVRIEALLALDEAAETDHFLTPVKLNLKQTLAQTTESADLVDREIGPFRIVQRIGAGGMGEVYLARRIQGYEQDVAIKVLRRVVETDEMLRRFRAETQFTAALGKHRNIASLIDAGTTDDGLLYLVMDYVDGERIDEYCDSLRLSNNDRLRLFLQVCEAVQFAHQNAVIHRDLKPSNILVSQDGLVHLIDFGIAKLVSPDPDSSNESTRTLFRILTPEYASPEQVRGELPTTASDVYSLGVVLYGLLTGRRPYEIETTNPQKMLHTIEHTQPLPPHQVLAAASTASRHDDVGAIAAKRSVSAAQLTRELAGDLGNILMMALRKESDRRYATVAQFADDIRNFLAGHPVIARKDTL
ncbi:MAG: serine/threonine protein kinase, partial [Planctomycetales bacterium]|nr:serine/threonine protein kinase [Planctomycetales bacterium]